MKSLMKSLFSLLCFLLFSPTRTFFLIHTFLCTNGSPVRKRPLVFMVVVNKIVKVDRTRRCCTDDVDGHLRSDRLREGVCTDMVVRS